MKKSFSVNRHAVMITFVVPAGALKLTCGNDFDDCCVQFSACTCMGLVCAVALFQTSSNQRPRLWSTVTANRSWRTRSNARQQAKMASTHSVMATSGCADRYSLSSESQITSGFLRTLGFGL